jgi:hypothetical protein
LFTVSKAILTRQRYDTEEASVDSWPVGETYVEETLTIYNGNIQIDARFPRCIMDQNILFQLINGSNTFTTASHLA